MLEHSLNRREWMGKDPASEDETGDATGLGKIANANTFDFFNEPSALRFAQKGKKKKTRETAGSLERGEALSSSLDSLAV